MTYQVGAKRASESFYEKILPFGEDVKLRDNYVNIFGDLRFGKLLEEMDMTAGIVAYAHADGFDEDLTIVTASCDRIDILGFIPSNCDLRIQSQVNYVGRSSMEIGIRLDSKIEEDWQIVSRAYFTMVARKGTKGHPVHRLLPETEDEWRREDQARKRSEKRKQEAKRHFLRSAPTEEESKILHKLFLETRNKDMGIPMSDTKQSSIRIMHPQERNIHHKIFGGHIMRESFENAWTIAHMFCRRRPLFVCVDQFEFIKPVEIGSFVAFKGLVTYTGKTSFIVEVTAEVIHPMSGERDITNISYFTFVAVDEACAPMEIPKVIPNTYEEGLKYLDGNRRYIASKSTLEKLRP